MKRLIYIDDLRAIPKAYCRHFDYLRLCKNYDEAIAAIQDGDYVDFDHDLGEGKNGYDIAKYIVENNIKIAGFHVHSMNPVGGNNIIELLTYYGYNQYH